MQSHSRNFRLLAIFFVVLIVSLACLSGGDDGNGDTGNGDTDDGDTADNDTTDGDTGPDLELTAASLQATQDAINNPPPQPDETEEPPPPPPPPPPPDTPSDYRFTVDNASFQTICYVNISPTTSDSWGSDWLGASDVIVPGSSFDFSVSGGTWDIRVQDCGNLSFDFEYELNVNRDMVWTAIGPGVGDTLWWTEFADSDPDNPNWDFFSIQWTGNDLAFNGGDFSADIYSGRLNVVAETADTYVYALYDAYFSGAFENVTVWATVEKVGGPNRNNIALICRANDEGWYEFAITSGGLWELYLYEYDDGYTRIGNGGSNAINMQFEVNDLALDCIDDEITLWANGSQVGSVTNNRFTEGQVGVSVSSFDLPDVEVEIDDFFVTWPGQ
ncbi:MAG: hypothetical protein FVQ83_08290 [Chloroflexi bacterium]|nr:hypothetical protein [Chloroflexota bacterium]